MAARKLQRSHAALKGIDPRNGFLSDETLLQFVGSEAFNSILKKYQTERMRAFRDQYREFDQKIFKSKESNFKHGDKRRKLLNEWLQTAQRYFGYSDFVQESIPHWDGEGFVPYLKSPSGSHSVAVLFAAEDSMPLDVESSGFSLTTSNGEKTTQPDRKETLSEQVERLIKAAGIAEAVLFLPYSAYYFRSESQTAGQYLEIRWTDILLDDNDSALSLATHLLSSDFFAYSQSEEPTETDENQEQADDADVEEGDEEASGGAVKTHATASSLLFREDLEQARKITEDLHKQVTLALEILINERLNIDSDLAKKSKTQNQNDKIAHQLFKDGLFVLYRILFVLYAEARRFLPVENPQYASFYSVEHLRNWAEEFLKRERQGHADPEGTYLWGAFESIFTLLRRGVKLSGGEFVSAFNGQLFAPDQAPSFDEGPALRDKAIAQVLLTLTRVGGEESGRRLHFANLGVEQLGAVYEALLAQKPVIVREESLWVPAHSGGVGLVTKELADALEMPQFEQIENTGLRASRQRRSRRATAGRLDTYISLERPGFNPTIGTFIVAPLGGQKRQTASFYTPPKLAQFLVRRTLKPLAEGKTVQEILNLRIVEPAVGSGGFLIAVLRYLGSELLKAKVREKSFSVRGREPNYQDLQEAKRQILENCLFAVDINPLSLELCRTSLYLEALVPGLPLPFLHHRFKCGNALIGADFLNRSRTSWDEDVEFPSIFDIPVDHVKLDKKIFESWDRMQNAYNKVANSDTIKTNQDQLVKRLRAEKSKVQDSWPVQANSWQHQLSTFLQLSRKALEEFEKLQCEGDVVDQLELRHKDHLSLIPDMDPVLIEAAEIKVDENLQRQRRAALIREHGIVQYNRMVKNQRAFSHLNALGDISTALWFWPVDAWSDYPSFETYEELIRYLLNNDGLDRTKKQKRLSKKAYEVLKIALKVAAKHRFFHWNVEFAQVFANPSYQGFNCLISNPPWKVVGVKDKDIYPNFDPTFGATKASGKTKKIQLIHKYEPVSAKSWFESDTATNRFSTYWQEGHRSEIRPSGKNDLATLFALSAERTVGRIGRYGLLVSRSAVFVNSGTRKLREHFFGSWGLEEAISFINFLKIFEIADFIEFSCLIGTNSNSRKKPRFIHAVSDLNKLEIVSGNLDLSDIKNVQNLHRPVELNLEIIRQYFARETLAIPGLTDPRQLEIAKALHQASGKTAYIDQIQKTFIGQGVNQRNGPERGISEYTENIRSSEIPNFKDVLKGRNTKWVPMYRGRHFGINDPFLGVENGFQQYVKADHLIDKGIDLSKPTFVWRAISGITNQRWLISSILPPGCWIDHNVYGVQAEADTLTALLATSTSICMDFIVRLNCTGCITDSVFSSLPIANYKSYFFDESMKVLRSGNSQKDLAKSDALMWLHYGQNKGALNRDNLIWMLDTQFDCLKRNSPDYIKDVIEAFDHYSNKKEMYGVQPTPIFKLNPEGPEPDAIPRSKKQKTSRSA